MIARRLFATPASTGISVLVVAGLVVALVPLARWAFVDAVWIGSPSACRVDGAGACWAFVWTKLEFILFGLFPPDERWRARLATVLLLVMVATGATPRFWSRWTVAAMVVGLGITLWLMAGGAGLARVPTRLWGGLPVTLLLTALGLSLGFPLGIVFAIARRGRPRLPRLLATTVVETVRGVPLIAVLYLAALVLPLALPRGFEPDKLLLAIIAVAVFASAYLAEAVRSGLQIIPKGQEEAATALGLRRWQVLRLVVLPQALRVVIPSFVSIAVGFFQDTSLVVVIGLFDLLNTTRLATQDPDWLGFHTEAFAFVAVLYLVGSGAISRYGRWLEARMSRRPT
jgi:general L-amino acid transport system permease protein